MGFIDDLASDIADDVWCSDEHFGEAVQFYPENDHTRRQDLTAVFHEYALEGTNEALGDGRTIQQESGRRERQSIMVDLPVSANVTVPGREGKFDVLRRVSDNSLWAAKRLISQDSATKKVLFVKGNFATKRTLDRTG